MKWGFAKLSVAVLSIVSFSSSFASSAKHVYGFESAKNYHSQARGSFYIQAAAFSNGANALRYQRVLQSQTAHPVKIARKNKLYIVVVGPISSALELRKTAAALLHSSPQKRVVRKEKTPKVIQYKPVPEQPKKIVSMDKDAALMPVVNTNANWFIAVGSGASFPTSKGSLFIDNGSDFPAPYDTDIYTTKQPTGALINVAAGRRWARASQWFPAFSLGVLYQHNFIGNVHGTVIQYSLPEFTNYNYHWDLSSDLLLASAKVNVYAQNRFSPYVTAGLGGAFNHAGYSETALPGVTPRISPNFSGNTNQFAYNVGAGIDFQATNNIILNVGYLYQNVGDISTQGSGTWLGTSFGLDNYEFNEVLGGVTYLFDK